jgi:hypothetical protein
MGGEWVQEEMLCIISNQESEIKAKTMCYYTSSSKTEVKKTAWSQMLASMNHNWNSLMLLVEMWNDKTILKMMLVVSLKTNHSYHVNSHAAVFS